MCGMLYGWLGLEIVYNFTSNCLIFELLIINPLSVNRGVCLERTDVSVIVALMEVVMVLDGLELDS